MSTLEENIGNQSRTVNHATQRSGSDGFLWRVYSASQVIYQILDEGAGFHHLGFASRWSAFQIIPHRF